MKIMYPNTYAESIVASTSNANFPVASLEDDYVGNLWKATAATATLTVECTAGSTCVAIFNTNATSVTVRISGWQAIDWEADATRAIDWTADATRTINWISFGQEVSETLYDISASSIGNLWAEYTVTGDLAHTLTITLTGSAIIHAGVLRVGIVRTFRNPAYGIREALRGYHIRKELNSGGFYTRKRGSAREISFELLEDRETDFYSIFYDYAQVIGPTPIPWRLVHGNVTDWEWVVFASIEDGSPSGDHAHLNDSIITIDLIESI